MNKFNNLYKVNQINADINNSKNKIVLLFDKIVFNLKEIVNMIKINNYSKKIELVNKTLDIIQLGLLDCIDFSIDKNLGNVLKSFYENTVYNIVLANSLNNISLFEKIYNEYYEFKLVWQKI